MMGIPPSNLPPSSSPSGRPSDSDKGRPKKEFQLPRGKGGKDEKEGEKENLFDLTKKEKKIEKGLEAQAAFQESLTSQAQAEVIKSQALSAIEAKQAVGKIAELIQKMVAELRVGTVGGKEFASLDLKSTTDVPSFFANSTLTLTQTNEGLIIRFSNFETPQQQAIAIQAVEQNKELLSQLMLNLQTKNIAVADMQIGNVSINLPRIERLPPPFRAPPSTEGQTLSEKRERQREDEGAGPQGEP